MKRILLVVFVICMACQNRDAGEEKLEDMKIITAGGTITEVVFELGFGEKIIATDITSTYPSSMQQLPSIGYRNQIKAEGILALGPDIILAEEGYLSNDVVNQLKESGIAIKFFKKPVKVEETIDLIHDLADYLEVSEKGNELVNDLQDDLQLLEEKTSSEKNSKPKVAFLMARGEEMVFLAGEETFASSIIDLAGGQHAGEGFKDFIPLTPESLVRISPDYLLFFESGIQSLGGQQGLKKIRGIEQTPAFADGNIIAFDGHYLSGFGPRVGKAALELAEALGY
ncbi:heme/hemin ABC transporter substrate-binding protein [Arthrospiribacter ruber]|uniref:ABC transporter substrate-binding protein n=1 Tax=Arthrospiribacter ruber TaxID=2487934 RepID=A0A951IX05_9BACT|nr:ABC transporter substrate-binding protein [Arthrospiribacter ruber]MBW3468418.1 ABC transporter substrate-binding protein [Arthrospiribacter ruber]